MTVERFSKSAAKITPDTYLRMAALTGEHVHVAISVIMPMEGLQEKLEAFLRST